MSPITLGVLAERLEGFMGVSRSNHEEMKRDVNQKHLENRNSIHKVNNELQEFHDDLNGKIETVEAIVNKNQLEIVTLKVKLAMYASIGGIGAGIVTAVITSILQRFIK